MLTIMLGCSSSSEKEGPQTHEVPADYSTIQQAINAADNGDVIVVSPGTYEENIDFKGKDIGLRSADPEDPETVSATIIVGQGNGTVVTMQSGESSNSALEGFTITGGEASRHGGGMIIDGSSPVIRGNIIEENTAQRGAGAFVTNGASPFFDSNTFRRNHATSRHGAGIYVADESQVVIENNTFKNHDDVDGVISIGASSTDDCNAVISGNIITDNTSDYGTGGISVRGSTAEITDNILERNIGAGAIDAAGAVTIRRESTALINHNTITENRAQNFGAVLIAEDSTAELYDNEIKNNNAGTDIESKDGSGGGIAVSSSDAIISSNTITDNTAWNTNSGGGGIYIRESTAFIDSNTIFRNRATRSGGGIYLRGHGFQTDAVVEIINNTISDNTAEGHSDASGGGINIGNIVEATIHGNTIDLNYAEKFGGGVYVTDVDEVPLLGPAETPWSRENSPPGDEVHNNYNNNEHSVDECGGADVFFRENYPCD